MKRQILVGIMMLLTNASISQPLQLPNGLSKTEFFGDILAAISFCNLTLSVDQYELGAGMRAFGVTRKEIQELNAAKTRHYHVYRRDFDNSESHQEFCIKIMQHPFISRVLRRGVPTIIGSDDRRQPEKIEFFGVITAKLSFCKINVSNQKFGFFMAHMGLSPESFPALREQIAKSRRDLVNEYSNPQLAAEMCREVRDNPSLERLFGP
ncbi:hypothetical protein [Rhabdaerophilum sp. SD176]|uniref:hypothetical protein n=1 Tax=Rhabdaerophilum sp. SD176 TaxID=2983548 RepID=UPI0024DF94AC|nr:hypothetical protein [Rhabdaerophilum sp. SD176]